MPSAYPSVSIIIPTASPANPRLSDCLGSIKNQRYPQQKLETIVVTNANLKKQGRPWSFAAAVNRGTKRATGELLLVTNDDVTLTPTAIPDWVKAASHHKHTILGGNISHLTEKFPLPSGYTMNLWTGIARPVYTGLSPTPCDWVSGCAMLVRRTLWQTLNGFDEGFAPGFFEDADFCLRARRSLDTKSLLIPSVKLLHGETTTFNRNKPKKYEYWYHNKIRFLTKHATPLQLATSLVLQYALFTPARALILHDGRFLPALKGLRWNLRNLKQTQVPQPRVSEITRNSHP